MNTKWITLYYVGDDEDDAKNDFPMIDLSEAQNLAAGLVPLNGEIGDCKVYAVTAIVDFNEMKDVTNGE